LIERERDGTEGLVVRAHLEVERCRGDAAHRIDRDVVLRVHAIERRTRVVTEARRSRHRRDRTVRDRIADERLRRPLGVDELEKRMIGLPGSDADPRRAGVCDGWNDQRADAYDARENSKRTHAEHYQQSSCLSTKPAIATESGRFDAVRA